METCLISPFSPLSPAPSLEKTSFSLPPPSLCISCIEFLILTSQIPISHGLVSRLFCAFFSLVPILEIFLFIFVVIFPLVFALAYTYTKQGMTLSFPPLFLLGSMTLHRIHCRLSFFALALILLGRLDPLALQSALILRQTRQIGSLCNNYLHMWVRFPAFCLVFFHQLFHVLIDLLFPELVFLVLSFPSLFVSLLAI